MLWESLLFLCGSLILHASHGRCVSPIDCGNARHGGETTRIIETTWIPTFVVGAFDISPAPLTWSRQLTLVGYETDCFAPYSRGCGYGCPTDTWVVGMSHVRGVPWHGQAKRRHAIQHSTLLGLNHEYINDSWKYPRKTRRRRYIGFGDLHGVGGVPNSQSDAASVVAHAPLTQQQTALVIHVVWWNLGTWFLYALADFMISTLYMHWAEASYTCGT